MDPLVVVNVAYGVWLGELLFLVMYMFIKKIFHFHKLSIHVQFTILPIRGYYNVDTLSEMLFKHSS